MKYYLLPLALLLTTTVAAQEKTEITEFNLAGPFAVSQPFAVDTVNVGGKQFNETSLLEALPHDAVSTTTWQAGLLPSLTESKSVGVLSFFLNNSDFVKGTINVEGPSNYKLFIDGKEAGADLKLAPEHHTLAVKFLAQPSDSDSIRVTIDANRLVVPTLDKAHPYMVHDLTDGRRVRGISLSADGLYAFVSYQTTERGGQSRWEYELRDVKTQRIISRPTQSIRWMPRTCAYIEDVSEDECSTKSIL